VSRTQITGEAFPLVIDQADITAPDFPRDEAWWRRFVPLNWITVEVRADGTVTLDARRERGCPHDDGTPIDTPLTDAQYSLRREGVVRFARETIGHHLAA
jgi:hypothetical protein